MDQQVLLREKEQEIAREVERWAREHLNLSNGQQVRVSVTLELFSKPVVEAEIHTRGTPRMSRKRLNYRTSTLSASDWERILGIPWSHKSRMYIGELHQSNNTRLKTSMRHSQMESMNLQFKKRQIGYRLRASEVGIIWPTTSVRLYIVE